MCKARYDVAKEVLEIIEKETPLSFPRLCDIFNDNSDGNFNFTSEFTFADLVSVEIGYGRVSAEGRTLRVTDEGKRFLYNA